MKISCPVTGCDKEVKLPTNMEYHLVHKHDMSPSQAKELLAKGADAPLSESPLGNAEVTPQAAAVLQEKVVELEARTMDDFTQIEKANFVIAWGKGLSPENKAIFATAVGIPIAGAAEVAESNPEVEPAIIQGKTDLPGYKFMEYLNLSVKT